jgi:hypothetical protein
MVRSGQDPIVVNLDIAAAEEPTAVSWVDPIHPAASSEGCSPSAG